MAIDRMQAMLKARLTARSFDGGDYLLQGQSGKILIHQLTGFNTDAGAYCGVKGEIVSVQPKVSGGATQPVGTRVQSTFTCNGKYANIGWEGVVKLVSALFDINMTDPEFDGINVAVFGKTGVSKEATKEEQADPFFAARGMLIGFSTSINAKSAAKRAAVGKEPITEIVWSHVSDTQGNSLAEIAERVKKLPPINL